MTLAITFHWIPNYWWQLTSSLFASLPETWAYTLPILFLGFALTLWAPRSFGLAWADTWRSRRVVLVIGGTMTITACVAMLFIATPFHGGSWAIFLCVPLAEELLFRGFIFAVLRDAFPSKVSVGRHRFSLATLLSAVAFGLWHLGGLVRPENGFVLFQVGYTTVAGFLFAIMRERTGSLIAPLLVHAVVNAWAVFVPSWWWVA